MMAGDALALDGRSLRCWCCCHQRCRRRLWRSRCHSARYIVALSFAHDGEVVGGRWQWPGGPREFGEDVADVDLEGGDVEVGAMLD